MSAPRSITPSDPDLVAVIARLCGLGYAPSVQEVTDEVGLASKGTTRKHLMRLRRLGLVTWEDGQVRTLRVTDAGLRLIATVPG